MATLILTPSVWEERLTTRFCIDLNLHDCFVAVESRDALERWQVSWPQPLRFSPATNTPIRRRRFIPWVPLDFICDTEPGDGWHTDDIRQPTIFKAVQKARLITIAGISSLFGLPSPLPELPAPARRPSVRVRRRWQREHNLIHRRKRLFQPLVQCDVVRVSQAQPFS